MSMSRAYANQDIFITGATGFIGKALIEKLLRSLPNVGKILVLLRSKRGKSADDRLRDLLQNPVFQRVRDETPEAFEKVIAVAGDCKEIGLGISHADLEKLRNVSVIFHVAATVRFDEYLKNEVLLNTRGTHEMVKIALKLPKLKILMHVSTAYSNPEKYTVEEKIYPAYADWRTTIKLAETYDEETLNILFHKYAPDHPNTYTFTKSLAEHIINDYRSQIPVAILRPSIVFSSLDEPFPGWVDNVNGLAGMTVSLGRGVYHTSHGNPDIVPDVVPVDMCVKGLLVAAYKFLLAEQEKVPDITKPTHELEVFNCCNGSKRYLSTGDMYDVCTALFWKNPFETCIWFCTGRATSSRIWHYYRFIILHIIPAIVLDCLFRLAGKRPFFMGLQRRVELSSDIFRFFLNTEWEFINDNFRALDKLIANKERSIFKFLDYYDCDQELYFSNSIKGSKQFYFKQAPEASKMAHVRTRMFWVLHYSYHFYIAKLLFKFIYSKITAASAVF